MRSSRRLTFVLAVLLALVGTGPMLVGASQASGPPVRGGAESISGRVMAGGAPLPHARVTLYAASDGRPDALARVRTDRDGRFHLRYRSPGEETVLYLLSRGGRAAAGPLPGRFSLAAVLGTGDLPEHVVVNEISTVGSAYAMAQFVDRGRIAGPAPGMPRAAAMVGHLTDVTTGGLGFSVTTYAASSQTTPRTIRSLANMLAACTADRGACGRLVALAQPKRSPRPTNTFEALAMIADDPWHAVDGLFDLSLQGPAPHRPALDQAPTAWTVAVRLLGPYVEAGGRVISSELDGPGLVAFDADGDAWISNNYEWGADPLHAVCAGKSVFELDPTVVGVANLTEYPADQLWGAGFGIAIDPRQRVWVGNFGFEGLGCATSPTPPPAVSVSVFGPDGSALSPSVSQHPPSGGYTAGGIDRPQGMLSDEHGNVWIANCGGRSVTLYPEGDPDEAITMAPDGLQQPFGLWLDEDGNAWVTSNQTGQVFAFAPDGTQLPGSPYAGGGLNRSMGITVDGAGNKWVANSFWVNAPCQDWKANAFDNLDPGGSLTLLQTDGPTATTTEFTADSLVNPWGIAVDGEDHVFVANFGGQRLAEFCGVQRRTCPAGSSTGDPIGDQGYPYDELVRNTGVSVDPSGHVWLANNWLTRPFRPNPGGHAVVVYFGLAEPIRTPVYGPPVPVFD